MATLPQDFYGGWAWSPSQAKYIYVDSGGSYNADNPDDPGSQMRAQAPNDAVFVPNATDPESQPKRYTPLQGANNSASLAPDPNNIDPYLTKDENGGFWIDRNTGAYLLAPQITGGTTNYQNNAQYTPVGWGSNDLLTGDGNASLFLQQGDPAAQYKKLMDAQNDPAKQKAILDSLGPVEQHSYDSTAQEDKNNSGGLSGFIWDTLPPILTAAALATVGASIVSGATAAGTGAFGAYGSAGSADAAGLAQMGADAGLTGQAATDFAASGGTAGSAAAGGAGVGTGAGVLDSGIVDAANGATSVVEGAEQSAPLSTQVPAGMPAASPEVGGNGANSSLFDSDVTQASGTPVATASAGATSAAPSGAEQVLKNSTAGDLAGLPKPANYVYDMGKGTLEAGTLANDATNGNGIIQSTLDWVKANPLAASMLGQTIGGAVGGIGKGLLANQGAQQFLNGDPTAAETASAAAKDGLAYTPAKIASVAAAEADSAAPGIIQSFMNFAKQNPAIASGVISGGLSAIGGVGKGLLANQGAQQQSQLALDNAKNLQQFKTSQGIINMARNLPIRPAANPGPLKRLTGQPVYDPNTGRFVTVTR